MNTHSLSFTEGEAGFLYFLMDPIQIEIELGLMSPHGFD